jgi:hypothetical protein
MNKNPLLFGRGFEGVILVVLLVFRVYYYLLVFHKPDRLLITAALYF